MTRETVRPMTDPQKSDIIATMVGAIPSLTFDEAQDGIIGAKGPFVADIQVVFERAKQRLVPVYPATGEAFELTLDGNAPENQPLEMVRRDGYSGDWKHKGPIVKGPETRQFKLVSVGYCANWAELTRKLAKQGEIPAGQWREAFKKKYPKHDGGGPIGVPDASWTLPDGDAYFPYVASDGMPSFIWAGDWFDWWRWLVEVRK